MDTLRCSACGGALEPAGWGPEGLKLCPGCGCGFLPADAARPEDYGAAYFDGSGAGGVDYGASKRQFQLINARRLDRILARAQGGGGALLELGCATGFFMEAAEARAWKAWGVELSAFAADRARERFGDRVFCGVLEDAPAQWGPFDLVAAFHVLEHLPDPKGTLHHLAGRLRAGGLAAFEVPDFGSSKARRLREAWAYFLPGEHLNYFTQAGLRRMLEAEGFEILEFHATSFTRLLGPLDKAGLKSLKALVLKALPWLRWIKGLVLGIRGLLGGHDCVLVIARLKGGPPAKP